MLIYVCYKFFLYNAKVELFLGTMRLSDFYFLFGAKVETASKTILGCEAGHRRRFTSGVKVIDFKIQLLERLFGDEKSSVISKTPAIRQGFFRGN